MGKDQPNVEVLPTDLPVAEPMRGGVACDPTYVGPTDARSRSESSPSLLPMPTPAESLSWGELSEEAAATADAFAELPDLHPSAPPSGHGMPSEFDQVDAPDIELAVPMAPPVHASSPPPERRRGPFRLVDPGPSVLVKSAFWERLPLAFVAPVLGKAAILLFLAAFIPALGSLVMTLDMGFIPRLLLFAPGALFSLGLLSEVFARLAQEGADNDQGVPSATLGDTDAYSILGAGAGTFFMGILLFALPTWLFFRGSLPLWALAGFSFLPYVYWPMALTVGTVRSDIAAMFDVLLVFRAVFRAPFKYAVVVALGFALTAGLSMAASLAIVGLSIATGPSYWLVPLSVFVFFGALTYLHGVLGYAMGRLVTTSERVGDLLSAS